MYVSRQHMHLQELSVANIIKITEYEQAGETEISTTKCW